jgi:DNA-binding NtrC family response regulator
VAVSEKYRPSLEPQPDKVVTILVVGDCAGELGDIFRHSNWRIHSARNKKDALDFLAQHRIPVVVSERRLPDGGWRDLLADLEAHTEPPNLIVACRQADEFLWSEVLNLGGYDVLAMPFEDAEVIRVIGLAWLHWKDQNVRRMPARSQDALTGSARSLSL